MPSQILCLFAYLYARWVCSSPKRLASCETATVRHRIPAPQVAMTTVLRIVLNMRYCMGTSRKSSFTHICRRCASKSQAQTRFLACRRARPLSICCQICASIHLQAMHHRLAERWHYLAICRLTLRIPQRNRGSRIRSKSKIEACTRMAIVAQENSFSFIGLYDEASVFSDNRSTLPLFFFPDLI